MSRQELIRNKARELGQTYFPDSANIWARSNVEAVYVENACVEMAEWLDQHPNWISVEDELPKNDGGFSDIVFVCTKDKRYYTAQFNYISNCWMAECSDDEITHWMQIVPPRREE